MIFMPQHNENMFNGNQTRSNKITVENPVESSLDKYSPQSAQEIIKKANKKDMF